MLLVNAATGHETCMLLVNVATRRETCSLVHFSALGFICWKGRGMTLHLPLQPPGWRQQPWLDLATAKEPGGGLPPVSCPAGRDSGQGLGAARPRMGVEG